MTIYLYIKQCSHCGLKYFGKTIKKNPYKYKGSGLHWKSHIKKHNASIETVNLWAFENEEECTNFAIRFCEDNNVIESSDWANLILETGKGIHPRELSENHKKKLSESTNSGRFVKGQISPRKGVRVSDEAKQKMAASKLGKKRGPHSPEHRAKISAAHRARHST